MKKEPTLKELDAILKHAFTPYLRHQLECAMMDALIFGTSEIRIDHETNNSSHSPEDSENS